MSQSHPTEGRVRGVNRINLAWRERDAPRRTPNQMAYHLKKSGYRRRDPYDKKATRERVLRARKQYAKEKQLRQDWEKEIKKLMQLEEKRKAEGQDRDGDLQMEEEDPWEVACGSTEPPVRERIIATVEYTDNEDSESEDENDQKMKKTKVFELVRYKLADEPDTESESSSSEQESSDDEDDDNMEESETSDTSDDDDSGEETDDEMVSKPDPTSDTAQNATASVNNLATGFASSSSSLKGKQSVSKEGSLVTSRPARPSNMQIPGTNNLKAKTSQKVDRAGSSKKSNAGSKPRPKDEEEEQSLEDQMPNLMGKGSKGNASRGSIKPYLKHWKNNVKSKAEPSNSRRREDRHRERQERTKYELPKVSSFRTPVTAVSNKFLNAINKFDKGASTEDLDQLEHLLSNCNVTVVKGCPLLEALISGFGNVGIGAADDNSSGPETAKVSSSKNGQPAFRPSALNSTNRVRKNRKAQKISTKNLKNRRHEDEDEEWGDVIYLALPPTPPPRRRKHVVPHIPPKRKIDENYDELDDDIVQEHKFTFAGGSPFEESTEEEEEKFKREIRAFNDYKYSCFNKPKKTIPPVQATPAVSFFEQFLDESYIDTDSAASAPGNSPYDYPQVARSGHNSAQVSDSPWDSFYYDLDNLDTEIEDAPEDIPSTAVKQTANLGNTSFNASGFGNILGSSVPSTPQQSQFIGGVGFLNQGSPLAQFITSTPPQRIIRTFSVPSVVQSLGDLPEAPEVAVEETLGDLPNAPDAPVAHSYTPQRQTARNPYFQQFAQPESPSIFLSNTFASRSSPPESSPQDFDQPQPSLQQETLQAVHRQTDQRETPVTQSLEVISEEHTSQEASAQKVEVAQLALLEPTAVEQEVTPATSGIAVGEQAISSSSAAEEEQSDRKAQLPHDTKTNTTSFSISAEDTNSPVSEAAPQPVSPPFVQAETALTQATESKATSPPIKSAFAPSPIKMNPESVFGKPVSAFGQPVSQPTSVFGAPAQASAPQSVFGAAPKPSAFGAPAAFGAAPTSAFNTATTVKSAFGAPTNTPASVFGAARSRSNSPAPSGATNPFAAPTSAPLSIPSSVFGARRSQSPAPSSVQNAFGAITKPSLFGAPTSFPHSAASTPPSTADSPEPNPEPAFPKNVFSNKTSSTLFGKQPDSAFSAQVSAASSPQAFPEPSLGRSSKPVTDLKPESAFETKSAAKKTSKRQARDFSDVESDAEGAVKSRKARFTTATDLGDLDYATAKARRDEERKRDIAEGRIPDGPMDFKDAKSTIGTCEDMCPRFEAIERQHQNNVDKWERGDDGRIQFSKAVKSFHRPAAGMEAPLPSDLRTEAALENTLYYLMEDLVGVHGLSAVHSFVRDRTRSIRQDYSMQHIENRNMARSYEAIARFHLVSIHCLHGDEGFDTFQELEQLRKTVLSLMQYYKAHPGASEREAEIRAYNIYLSLYDQNLAMDTQKLPPSILNTREIQLALNIQQMFLENQYARLHSVAKECNYLESCALHWIQGEIARKYIEQLALTRSYQSKHASIEKVSEGLELSDAETRKLMTHYGVKFSEENDGLWVPESGWRPDDSKALMRLEKNLPLFKKTDHQSVVNIIFGKAFPVRPLVVKEVPASLNVSTFVLEEISKSRSVVIGVYPKPPVEWTPPERSDYPDGHYTVTSPYTATVQRFIPPSAGFPKGQYPDGEWDDTIPQDEEVNPSLNQPIPRISSYKFNPNETFDDGEVLDFKMPVFAKPTPSDFGFEKPATANPFFRKPAPSNPFAPATQTSRPQSVFAQEPRPAAAASPFAPPPPPASVFNPAAKPFVPTSVFGTKAPEVKETPKIQTQTEAPPPAPAITFTPPPAIPAVPSPVKPADIPQPAPTVTQEPEPRPPSPVKEVKPRTPSPEPVPVPDPWIAYEEEALKDELDIPKYFTSQLPESVATHYKRWKQGARNYKDKSDVIHETIRILDYLGYTQGIDKGVVQRKVMSELAQQHADDKTKTEVARKLKRKAQNIIEERKPKRKLYADMTPDERRKAWENSMHSRIFGKPPIEEISPSPEPVIGSPQPAIQVESTTPPNSPPPFARSLYSNSSTSSSGKKRTRDDNEDEDTTLRYSFHVKRSRTDVPIRPPPKHTYLPTPITPQIAENRRRLGYGNGKSMTPFQVEQIAITKLGFKPWRKEKEAPKAPEIPESKASLLFASILGEVEEEMSPGRSMRR